jgi:hypothetical protein
MHPDYRAVVTGKRPALIHPSDTTGAVSSIPGDLTGSLPPGPGPAPAGHPPDYIDDAGNTNEAIEEYDPAKDPTPVQTARPSLSQPGGSSRVRRLRLMLALAMGLGGITLVGGGALAAWRHLLPLLEPDGKAPSKSEGMPPEPMPSRPDSFPTVYPVPALPLPVSQDRPARDSSTGDVRTSRLRATRNRTPGYFEAYADARAEMDEAFDYIHFQRVFDPTRLAAPESLRATRRMVAAAMNIVRVYRGREVMLEQTYHPGDAGGRGSFREPFETAESARSLMADADSLLGVLIGQQGRISYDGRSVAFKDPRAAAAYVDLRSGILSTMDEWKGSIEAQDLVTIPRILRALGTPPPPPRR